MSKSVTDELGKLFSNYKEEKVELITEEVVEKEVLLSEDEQTKFNLFSGLIQSLSETNEKEDSEKSQKTTKPKEDDPSDDITDEVSDWIKKDIEEGNKKVEALEELFAPLTDIPITEPVEEEIIEETVSPIEEEVVIEKKPEQPKKPRTIKKALVSIDEQKFMSKVLHDMSKLPPEEKPVDMSEQSFPNAIKDSLLTPDQTSLQRKAAQPEDSLTRLRKEFEQFRTVMQRNLEAKQNAYDGNSGSGAVKIQDMDDVDTDTALVNGNVFRFNSTSGKFDGVAPVTEAIIQEGTENAKILLNGTDSDGTDAGGFISLQDDTFGSLNLGSVTEDINPDQTNVRNLGSSSRRFKELFLAGQTIDLGGATISSDGTGTVSISSDGVTLPTNSKVGSDTIAKAGTNGKTSIDVEFFSRAGGTSTANATFKFQSKGNSYVFTDSGTFTLAAGTALEDQNPELFTF